MDDDARHRTAFHLGQREILEQIAGGASLSDLLERIVVLIERQSEGMVCSILLLNEDGNHVNCGAAPHMPGDFTRAIEGAPIGPKAGSCGTAAYRRERVIVEDVATHPYWEGYRELLLPHGLRACWSSPIFAPGREVLGTFAMYYYVPRGPLPKEIGWVDEATHLAAIAILRDRSAQSLKRSERRYRQLIDTAYEGVWTIDKAHQTTFVNRRMAEMLGETPERILGRSPLDFVDPSQRGEAARSLARMSDKSGRHEFKLRREDGSTFWAIVADSPIFDEKGQVTGTLGLVTDITEQKTAEHRAEQIAHLYAVSSGISEAIVRVRDTASLWALACRIPVEQGLANLAWVGLCDASDGSVRPVARFGEDNGYIDRVSLLLNDPRIARDPTGRTVQIGVYSVSNDIANDPDSEGKSDAMAMGFRSCAAFPLIIGGRVYGVFTLYSRQTGRFGTEERRVLDALAADIAFAIESANTEAERRRLVNVLAQRVKELTLLHRTARLLQAERHFDNALLSELVALFPATWRHSHLCGARIAWKDCAAATSGWRDTPWKLAAEFDVAGDAGVVEVVYREAPPSAAAGVFLPEEEQLLQSIADMLAAHLGRQQGQDALRQSEERLRAVVEYTPNVAIQWFDDSGRILFCNQASERLFGWPPSTAVGRTLEEMNFPAADAERFMDALRGVDATGVPHGPTEFRFRRADGEEGVLLSTVFRIPTSSGGSCFVCMDVDLTEHRRMEEAVRANEKLRSLIFSSVTDVIFYLAVESGDQFRFLSVNPAFLLATGLAEEQVVGRLVNEVIPEPSCRQAIAKYKSAIDSESPLTWEEVSAYPSGARYGEVTVTPVFDSFGRCTNLVGTVHDITARKLAEEERHHLETQLHQSQRMQSLGTLAGGIAHDFNNILTAIGGNTELALSDLPKNHPVCEYLTEIQHASGRATELVRQILAFGRRQAPDRTVVDLGGVIEEALKLLRAALPALVQIRTRLSPDTPPVAADSTQIHQVIMNLGINAAHAVGANGGNIEVASDLAVVGPSSGHDLAELADGRYACVSVTDTGCGMDQATLARVFEPFFTTKPVGVGTGLGLSVVHGIMKSHQGAVTVSSRLGEGTSFRLYFPAADGVSVSETEPAASGTASGRGEHIFYVDDEEALVFLGKRMLTRLGYRVTGHSDPVTALYDFRSRPFDFDAVVTDMTMPELSGPDLVRELIIVRPDVPIVMLSGYMRPEDEEAVRQLGVRDILLKSNTAEALGQALHRLLKTVPKHAA